VTLLLTLAVVLLVTLIVAARSAGVPANAKPSTPVTDKILLIMFTFIDFLEIRVNNNEFHLIKIN
jgi:hypothetical protein